MSEARDKFSEATLLLPKLLLIDTCGEAAGVALSQGNQVVAQEELGARSASAEIVGAVRGLLQRVGWRLAELQAVGVVNGPGSFTGVRTGLAAAKGVCEAAGLPLAAVSRLAVLAELADGASAPGTVLPAQQPSEAQGAASFQVIAVLDAGRGECFVRSSSVAGASEQSGRAQDSHEWVCGLEELRVLCAGRLVIAAEENVAVRLAGCSLIMRSLTVADALRPVLRCLEQGGSDVATVDANYVRGESDIYRPATAAAQGDAA